MIGHDGALSIEVNVRGHTTFHKLVDFVFEFGRALWNKHQRNSFATHKIE